MLFNFFNKNDKQSEKYDNEALASITYIFFKNSDYPMMDVEMRDYNDESIKGLCRILDVLASEKALVETVDIIKNAMINDGEGDKLMKIFSHLDKYTRDKMIHTYTNHDNESPCIKPSEVFMTR